MSRMHVVGLGDSYSAWLAVDTIHGSLSVTALRLELGEAQVEELLEPVGVVENDGVLLVEVAAVVDDAPEVRGEHGCGRIEAVAQALLHR
jgi:hypothetical protein